MKSLPCSTTQQPVNISLRIISSCAEYQHIYRTSTALYYHSGKIVCFHVEFTSIHYLCLILFKRKDTRDVGTQQALKFDRIRKIIWRNNEPSLCNMTTAEMHIQNHTYSLDRKKYFWLYKKYRTDFMIWKYNQKKNIPSPYYKCRRV